MSWSVWIEGEFAGEFGDPDDAIAEAGICAAHRRAPADVVDDQTSETICVVRACARDALASDE